MTNKDLTLIAALLDRTGSMQSCRRATEDGFNEFINGQRAESSEAIVTLAQFDRDMSNTHPVVEFVYRNKPIDDVPKLELVPRGMTPLLDAIGGFVTQVGQDLAALPDDERPGLVICVIMTDGHENASKEWNWARVRHLVKQQQDQWQWQFVFLGANINAEQVADSIGIPMAAAMTFDSHNDGAVMDSYMATSGLVSNVRAAAAAGVPVAAAYTDEDRDKAIGKK